MPNGHLSLLNKVVELNAGPVLDVATTERVLEVTLKTDADETTDYFVVHKGHPRDGAGSEVRSVELRTARRDQDEAKGELLIVETSRACPLKFADVEAKLGPPAKVSPPPPEARHDYSALYHYVLADHPVIFRAGPDPEEKILSISVHRIR